MRTLLEFERASSGHFFQIWAGPRTCDTIRGKETPLTTQIESDLIFPVPLLRGERLCLPNWRIPNSRTRPHSITPVSCANGCALQVEGEVPPN
jgi:hypothetical protein